MIEETIDPAPPPAGQPLGMRLAQLRREAGLTGVQLGRRVKMSQAKISKIETGATSPSIADVRRIAQALGASRVQIENLVELARRLPELADAGRRDVVEWQRAIAQLEARTTTVRSFQPAILIGLLQTSEYARALFANYPPTRRVPVGPGGIAAAIAARMGRQAILADPTKRFHFVLPETLLETVLVGPLEMSSQLARIRDIARQENVTVSIIPTGALLPFPPHNGFTIHDDSHVIVDLLNTVLLFRESEDVRLYQDVFNAYEAVATTDVEPILDNYLRRYLERTRLPRAE